MLSPHVEEIGRDFYLRRLRAAEAHRRAVVDDTDAYRVVHGEADLLPALIVDRYGDYLVLQTLDQGMDAAKSEIASCLVEIFQPRGIVARNDAPIRAKEQLPLETAVLAGEAPKSVAIHMNGLTMRADLLAGQKTGIFLDQRENYRAAALCPRRQGARLLHFHRRLRPAPGREMRIRGGRGQFRPRAGHGARQRRANQIANIHFQEADVFDLLASHSSARRQYSLVVLDPPAFAKSRRNLDARRHRLQGNQPARAAPARARRNPGHLFLLAPRQRGHVPGTRGASLARRQPHPARAGAPHAGAGPPHPPRPSRRLTI